MKCCLLALLFNFVVNLSEAKLLFCPEQVSVRLLPHENNDGTKIDMSINASIPDDEFCYLRIIITHEQFLKIEVSEDLELTNGTFLKFIESNFTVYELNGTKTEVNELLQDLVYKVEVSSNVMYELYLEDEFEEEMVEIEVEKVLKLLVYIAITLAVLFLLWLTIRFINFCIIFDHGVK